MKPIRRSACAPVAAVWQWSGLNLLSAAMPAGERHAMPGPFCHRSVRSTAAATPLLMAGVGLSSARGYRPWVCVRVYANLLCSAACGYGNPLTPDLVTEGVWQLTLWNVFSKFYISVLELRYQQRLLHQY